MGVMAQAIRNPVAYLTVRPMTECHVCESEYATCYVHSQHPDLAVCGDCISTYGGWHGHPRDSAKSNAFQVIEDYLARR